MKRGIGKLCELRNETELQRELNESASSVSVRVHKVFKDGLAASVDWQ